MGLEAWVPSVAMASNRGSLDERRATRAGAGNVGGHAETACFGRVALRLPINLPAPSTSADA
jgi:hypothetical protein